MRKLLAADRLVIATHNNGKLQEFNAILGPYLTTVTSAGVLGLPEPEETGTTFVDNALLKAKAAANATGNVALADDSGLCVSGLNGDPGLYSARWGGPTKDFGSAMKRVHEALGSNPDRSAYFICVLALVWPDGHFETFEGRIDGDLVWPPRGANGHGYDPMFQAKDFDKTFAEIDPAQKNVMSHRGRAVRKLLATLELCV